MTYCSFAACSGRLRSPCYCFVDEPCGENIAYLSILVFPISSLRYACTPRSCWVAMDRRYHPNFEEFVPPPCSSSSSCDHPSGAFQRRRNR